MSGPRQLWVNRLIFFVIGFIISFLMLAQVNLVRNVVYHVVLVVISLLHHAIAVECWINKRSVV